MTATAVEAGTALAPTRFVDVGGTRIKAGIVDPDARVHTERVIDTGRADGPEVVTERLLDLIDELAATARRSSMGGPGIRPTV